MVSSPCARRRHDIRKERYDALGRQQATAGALRRRSAHAWDNVGRYQAGISPLGFATTLIYDLRGSQIARLNARGFRTTTP